MAPSVHYSNTSQGPRTADTTIDLAKFDSPPPFTPPSASSTQEAPPEPTEKEQSSPPTPTPQLFGGGSSFGSGRISWGIKESTTSSVTHSFAEMARIVTTEIAETATPSSTLTNKEDHMVTASPASRMSYASVLRSPIQETGDKKSTTMPPEQETHQACLQSQQELGATSLTTSFKTSSAERKEYRAQILPKASTRSPLPPSSTTGATTPGPSSLPLNAPSKTTRPTLAPSTTTYVAAPTIPPRQVIHGKHPNNLDVSSVVDLRNLPIAAWCTPDSEFKTPQDLPYDEAHSHNWSMEEQWMRTCWHPKRFLRNQNASGEGVAIPIPIPIRSTTAQLVDMMPCKEFEDIALLVPMPRNKYRSSKEQRWGADYGSGSAEGWGRNAKTLSSSPTSSRAVDTPVQKLGQEKPKEKAKKKKRGSCSEEDKEVINISDESDAEDQIPIVETKKGQQKKVQATTTAKSSNNEKSTVIAGKVPVREPLLSSSSSWPSWEDSLTGDKSDQAMTSKLTSYKKMRKAIQAEKRAHKVPKDKQSPSTEKERKLREQECLEEGGGTFGTAPRQSRCGSQDEAVGVRLRSGRDGRTNAYVTHSSSGSSLPLDSSSTQPDPASFLPLGLPAAGAAPGSLVDRAHHPLEVWRAMAMVQLDKFNSYVNLSLFGAGAAAPRRSPE
ncbi:hypothetical protein BGZ93_008279, partial [Podila epicladia]